jgi:hypothetical protein
MLAKIAGIIVLVWFYRTAHKIGEKAIQWAVIGVIGFWLAAFITHLAAVDPLLKVVGAEGVMPNVIRQLPAFVGFGAAYFIRRKYLLKNAGVSTPSAE